MGTPVGMTTIPDPTVQTPIEHTQTIPVAPEAPVAVRGSGTSSSHVGDVRPEDPKRNPVTYAALAIALLALVLSIAALTRDSGGPDQIEVGGKRCLVQRIDDNKAATLFCQT